MSTQIESEPSFDNAHFQRHLPQYYRALLTRFRKIVQTSTAFHLIYGAVFLLELSVFIGFFPFFTKSAFLALGLAALVLTGFSYFVLLLYLQGRKPELFQELSQQFLQSCRQILPLPPGEAQHHLFLADALLQISSYLTDFELPLFSLPKPLSFFNPPLAYLFSKGHREPIFQLQTLLLKSAVEELLQQIRLTPTDLEVHASLANTYVFFSKIYQAKDLAENHQKMARMAIEEFSILSHYAPSDPWVHEQLASGYRDLSLAQEETKEVEILLKLRPTDKEILYRLGTLYFKQGLNAKGLQVYEELKKANFKKAEDLIGSYGTFFSQSSSFHNPL